jgi:hypothetical protein
MFSDWGGCTSGGVATLDCIPAVFANLLSAILALSGVVALLMFIMAGVRLIYSAGDAKKVEAGKNTLIYGIIGLAVVLLSFAIISIISQVTGVTCITKFGFGCQ